jgi:Na+/pantothenate symporter
MKILRRMFGGIKISEIWRKRYNKELMQLFGDLDVLSFFRINLLI